jgi:hypothetical protein
MQGLAGGAARAVSIRIRNDKSFQLAIEMWWSGREAKNLVAWGVWRWWCQRPQERKFFASFFQKRSSFLASFDT